MAPFLFSAFASASLQVLIEKLTNLGINFIDSISNPDDKLKKLERTLFKVQILIRDADEEKQASNMAWQVLLRDLEDLVYEADDLVEEITFNVSQLEAADDNYKEEVNQLYFSFFKRFSAHNMDSIQDKFDGMLREIDILYMRELVQHRHFGTTENNVQSSSLAEEFIIPQRKEDQKEILNMLLVLEESSVGNVSTISIVGMPGVGNTTIAQFVYNCDYEDFNKHFELKMWVSVGQGFNVVEITRSIIEAATGESSRLVSLDKLQVKLKNIILEKNFLLVLDDVWNEKRSEWELLLKPLKHGGKGSKIIVTTRSQDVSSLVSPGRTYRLDCVSEEDCWLLIKEIALRNVNAEVVQNLENIGRNIGKKCQGLPLVAKILGGLLQSKVHEDEWAAILNCKILDVSEVKREIAPSLRLSYLRLSAGLKQCFAYCSMFPRNHEFDKDKLILMWIGGGFILPEGKERKEDIGKAYFDQLCRMSFFQNKDDTYRMHDIIHDMAQSVSSDRFVRIESKDGLHASLVKRNARHSSLQGEDLQKNAFEVFYKCNRLRTFIISGQFTKEIPFALFQKLGLLRVLDLSSTDIGELDDSVGNLKYLRFLDLSRTLLKELPATIHQLSSLQTLWLKDCSEFLSLPNGIERLISLEHLELKGSSKFTFMPSGIGKLTNLQSLNEFFVGSQRGQVKELKELNNLRGSLSVKNLEKVNNPQEAEDANLVNKKWLDKLEFYWSSNAHSSNEFSVLTKLHPPENLKDLKLKKYNGTSLPSWISSPLFIKLESISLYECENCEVLPSLGELPKLKSLLICGMRKLETVDSGFCGNLGRFASLETLQFRDMYMLVSWSGLRMDDMKCLRELSIVNCPQMVVLQQLHYLMSLEILEFDSLPLLPSLSRNRLSNSIHTLTIMDCPLLQAQCRIGGADWIKIEHIPNKYID